MVELAPLLARVEDYREFLTLEELRALAGELGIRLSVGRTGHYEAAPAA